MNDTPKFNIGDKVSLSPNFRIYSMTVNRIEDDGYVECVWTEYNDDLTNSSIKSHKFHPKNLYLVPEKIDTPYIPEIIA